MVGHPAREGGGGPDPGPFFLPTLYRNRSPTFTHMEPMHSANNNIACAYIRVSTDEQKLGPEAQRKSIEEFAIRESLTIISWHVDQGISGSTKIDERPALISAFGAIQAHGAGRLIIARRDRIARDVLIAIMVERELLQWNAKLVSADGIGAGDSPEAEMMRGIIDLFAQYERALIRMRTKAALAVKKAKGEPVGRPRFGFTYVDGVLAPDQDEQTAVDVIRGLRQEGKSIRGIVAEMQRRDIRTRHGKPFYYALVSDILHREKESHATSSR